MVETITPMVHGGSRARWAAAVALHTLAATIVAAGFGAVLAGVGHLVGAPWGGAWWPLMTLAAFAAAAHELVGMPFPLPQLRRQVPDWWRTFFGPYIAAVLYGGALGVGFLTYVTRTTLVVVAVAVIVSGDPVLGVALMAPFGFARGIGAIAGGSADGHAVDRLARIGAGRLLPVANATAVALVGITAMVSGPRFDAGDAGDAAAAVLAATFAWGAAWKVLRPAAWRRVLAAHRLGAVGAIAAVGVPLAEAAVVAIYAAGRPDVAAVAGAAMVATGTAAVIRARIRSGPRLACGCFGEEARDYRASLARNVVLLGLAVIAASSVPVRVLRGPSLPGTGDVAPVVLAIAGSAALVWAAVSVRRALRHAGAVR